MAEKTDEVRRCHQEVRCGLRSGKPTWSCPRNTKLFCPAHIEFGGEPNTELTPVSLGLPGSLPVINKTAVDYAIKLGLALHCEIAEWSQFARKNYFYPDMPRDYQISQYDKPTNGNGYLDVELEDGTVFRVPIERAHIEDDAGKNTHVGGADGRIEGADHSLVDYNRAGVPLIEIVTKPIEGAAPRSRNRRCLCARHPRHRARVEHLPRSYGAGQHAR